MIEVMTKPFNSVRKRPSKKNPGMHADKSSWVNKYGCGMLSDGTWGLLVVFKDDVTCLYKRANQAEAEALWAKFDAADSKGTFIWHNAPYLIQWSKIGSDGGILIYAN